MQVWDSLTLGVALVALGGCGGCARPASSPAPAAPAPTPVATAGTPAAPEAEPPALVRDVPRDCAAGTERCFPPDAFVASLCQGKYPDVALLMFSKEAPWQHAYVKVPEVMPVNNFDGPVTHEPLVFSEEVLLLKHRPFHAVEGYDVVSPDRYDVLRLSGSCASLAEDELRMRWAGPSKYAPLVWTWLEEGMRQSLASSESIERDRRAQQEACGGRYVGGGSASCQRATDALARSIMQEINAGLELPLPELRPAWASAD